MKITIVTVGKIKEKYLRDAVDEYSKRLSKYCKLEIIQVADEKTPRRDEDKSGRKIIFQCGTGTGRAGICEYSETVRQV